MKRDKPDASKRSFLKKALGTVGLLSGGGAIGWWIQGRMKPGELSVSQESGKTAVQAYDLEEFMDFDPKHLTYREVSGFATGMERVSRLALGPTGDLWVAGGTQARSFSRHGVLKRTIALPARATSLAHSPRGDLYVALSGTIIGVNQDGDTIFQTESMGEKSVITGLAVTDEHIVLSDAGQRLVIICDRQGTVIQKWGLKDGDHPGFVIPSPFFPLRLDDQNQVFVANTGRLRVETYLKDGTYRTSWGRPGMDVSAFCGCCNPVYIDLTKNGDVITSEKGLVRIHRYRQDGTFVGVVAGPRQLWQGMGPESKLERKGKMGDPFDIAVGGRETVYALDPHRCAVRVFVPKNSVGEGQ